MHALIQPLLVAGSLLPHPDSTDERLMELIKEHGEGGLTRLHERYGLLLKALSMNVLHNHSEAEELLQDVFVEIWKRAGTYDPLKGRPLAWIITLTRRRSIDRLRRREAYERAQERFIEDSSGREDGWTHVQEEIADSERNVHLKRALAALPPLQRDAIKLAYYGEMSQREIAGHTGIPLGTIKTRLELGLLKMARSLQGLEGLLGDPEPGEIKRIRLRPAAARVRSFLA
jgi:RNA polymerase sigma-70 factor, ECF subfamily